MMFVAAAALFLSAGAFLTYELLGFRAELSDQVQTLAHVLARNCTAALVFQDERDAEDVLSGLQEERHLMAGAVYAADGQLFAEYQRPGSGGSVPKTAGELGARFHPGSLVVFTPVIEAQRRVGTIYLQMSVAALNQRLKVYLVTLTAILLASLALAWLLSWKL